MKALFILLFFLPFISFSQEYTEVVEVPGKTSGQLYSIAREWFAKSFISADNTLLMDDRISGKIIAKGSFHISDSTSNVVWYPNFTIEISFKDGRYKNEITDISITSGVSENSSGTTSPFKKYLDKKENYKNLGDPGWRRSKRKIGKETAIKASEPYQSIYNLICKTESELKDILSKIQIEMKKSEGDW